METVLDRAGALVALALVDSTSIGTLLIPLWLMLLPRVRVGVLLVYLATSALFYLLVGLALASGLDPLLQAARPLVDARWVAVVQLVVGVGLVAYSFRFPWGPAEPSPRLVRWRERLSGERLTIRGAVVLALSATLLEVATMLPYLAALGIVAAAELSAGARVGVLTIYVVVMVLPALVLLTLRVLVDDRLRGLLQRIGDWLAVRTGATMGWICGVVGVLVAYGGVGRLAG